MMEKTEITFEFDSSSENESLARTVVAAFLARLDPTLEELADVKTAVSEAVTNAIIHGYEGKQGKIRIHSWIEDTTSLLSEDEKKQYFFKFNLEGLLRGDYQSRMNGYAIARQNGWMSANDIRELEDLDKLSPEQGGDLYLVNGNMLPLKKAGAYADKNNEKETDNEEVLELEKPRRRNTRESS